MCRLCRGKHGDVQSPQLRVLSMRRASRHVEREAGVGKPGSLAHMKLRVVTQTCRGISMRMSEPRNGEFAGIEAGHAFAGSVCNENMGLARVAFVQLEYETGAWFWAGEGASTFVGPQTPDDVAQGRDWPPENWWSTQADSLFFCERWRFVVPKRDDVGMRCCETSDLASFNCVAFNGPSSGS